MGKFSLLSVFHTSLLAKPLNFSLVVLFILTQSFQMGFAHEIGGPNFTNQPSVASSQIVEPSQDSEFKATAIRTLPSYADFMDPSPLSTVADPRAMPGSLFRAHETSATVELESVTRSGAHYTDSKGTMIFADGRLAFDQPHLAEGIYDITIYAFGFPQSSATPQFRMLADNKMISGPVEVTNQDWTYRPYTISNVELVGDGHDFRIELPGGFGEVNLYLDKVVFEKTGDLLPPAERVVIEAETMTAQGGFYQAPNSMLLWSNGSLTSQREVESGVYDVEIVAFGLDGEGALPQMRLLAGNHMVGDAVAVRKNDWNYQGYLFSGVELEGGMTDFMLQFFNDSPSRDLWVDKIILRKRGELAYQGNRLVRQAENLSAAGASFATATATTLWNDGVLRLPLSGIQSGKYRVEFDGFGAPLNGTLPRAQVLVDGTVLGEPLAVANNDWNYQRYQTLEVDLQGGDHEILIKLAPGFESGNLWLDRVVLRKTGELAVPQNTQVFSVALDSTIRNSAETYGILAETASGGIVGWAAEVSKAFLKSIQDQFDFVVFVPTLKAAKSISNWTTDFFDSNGIGSFSAPIRNDIEGIGFGKGDYSSFFGSSDSGEMEAMVYLDSGLSAQADFRLSTSNFSNPLNLPLWVNVAAQELHHRFGSYLTSDFSNPLGIVGRQLAHWGPFFDADFSPMDGNDWVDNEDGTFTVARSYYDEALFHRTTNLMPFNDFDLYSMGLLSASEVKAGFVIENPRLASTGQRVRPHVELGDDPSGGGPSIEIEQANGSWVVAQLANGDRYTGTKRVVTVADIIGYEGARSPAAPEAERNFSAAFVVLTDSGDTSASIQAQKDKAITLQNALASYFLESTRGLGSLNLPRSGISYAKAGFAAVAGQLIADAAAPVNAGTAAAHRAARSVSVPPVLPVHREYLVKDMLRTKKRVVKSTPKASKRKDWKPMFSQASPA